MKLLYCDQCGTVIKDHQSGRLAPGEAVRCAACRENPGAANARRKPRARDSGQIPRSKISAALRRSAKGGLLPEVKP